MTIDSMEMIAYTLQFVVPGYLIVEIISSIMPRTKYSEGVLLVQTIGYSAINYMLWSWAFWLIDRNVSHNSIWSLILYSIVLLLTSVLTGTLLGYIRKTKLSRKVFSILGMNTEHPIPSAWDYRFSDGNAYWMEITISDGRVIRGLYSNNSFASSDKDYKDLYLEQLYRLDEQGKWILVNDTAGVWINPEEIRYVKFYTYGEKQNDEE